jgi:hypothetical protein
MHDAINGIRQGFVECIELVIALPTRGCPRPSRCLSHSWNIARLDG